MRAESGTVGPTIAYLATEQFFQLLLALLQFSRLLFGRRLVHISFTDEITLKRHLLGSLCPPTLACDEANETSWEISHLVFELDLHILSNGEAHVDDLSLFEVKVVTLD